MGSCRMLRAREGEQGRPAREECKGRFRGQRCGGRRAAVVHLETGPRASTSADGTTPVLPVPAVPAVPAVIVSSEAGARRQPRREPGFADAPLPLLYQLTGLAQPLAH